MTGPSRIAMLPLALASGLFVLIGVASASPAAADGRDGRQFLETDYHLCGHRFEPGPIVGGHNRQPTPAEFEARLRQYSCAQKQCSPLPNREKQASAAHDQSFTPGNCF